MAKRGYHQTWQHRKGKYPKGFDPSRMFERTPFVDRAQRYSDGEKPDPRTPEYDRWIRGQIAVLSNW